MSFTLEPGKSGKITFHLTYKGDGTPDDAHIYLLDPQNPGPDHAKEIIILPQMPEGEDPGGDLQIPYFPGAAFPRQDGKLVPGVYTFALAWSFKGKPNQPDPDHPSYVVQPDTPKLPKEWDWGVFWAKFIASCLGSAASGAALNWWTVTAVLPCVLTGVLGGAISSVLGQLAVWFFDAPRKWTSRSAFLFTLFFTLSFSLLFGLLAIHLEIEAAARGELLNRVTFGVSFFSGFLATSLTGVLDNLHNDAAG
jgi:hypothetical protein